MLNTNTHDRVTSHLAYLTQDVGMFLLVQVQHSWFHRRYLLRDRRGFRNRWNELAVKKAHMQNRASEDAHERHTDAKEEQRNGCTHFNHASSSAIMRSMVATNSV